MRLILDLHISGKRVGRALSAAGHDVRAADAEDERLLAVAASEDRLQTMCGSPERTSSPY